MTMNRRDALKFLSLGAASTTAVASIPAHTALEAPLVYDIQVSVPLPSSSVRLDFTARRGHVVVITGVAHGDFPIEAAEALAGILRPKSPDATDWVLNTWLPRALEEGPRGVYSMKLTAAEMDQETVTCFDV